MCSSSNSCQISWRKILEGLCEETLVSVSTNQDRAVRWEGHGWMEQGLLWPEAQSGLEPSGLCGRLLCPPDLCLLSQRCHCQSFISPPCHLFCSRGQWPYSVYLQILTLAGHVIHGEHSVNVCWKKTKNVLQKKYMIQGL